jgi:PAS domain S-box-containing protein
MSDIKTIEPLERENQELRARLREAEETLAAIRAGEVDALVVRGPAGEQVFTLSGEDKIYRLLVEAMSEAALTATPEGRILFCNERFSEMLGRPTEEIIGRSVAEFVQEASHNDMGALLESSPGGLSRKRLVFTAGDGTLVPSRASARVLHQDGSANVCIVAMDLSELEASKEVIRQIQEHQQALRDSAASLRESQLAALNVMEDAVQVRDHAEALNIELQREIAERKKAEQQLRDREQQLKLVIEGGQVGTFQWDLQTDTVACNNILREMLGLAASTQQVTGKALMSCIHPEDRKRVEKHFGQVVSKGNLFKEEYRIVRGDGHVRWISSRGRLYRDRDGKAFQMAGVSYDISRVKFAEEEVRSVAKFPAENPFPVLRLKADGTIVYSNTPGQVLLELWGRQVREKAPENWQSLARTTLRYGRHLIEEVRCGSRLFSFAITPVREGQYVNLYGRDITVQQQIKDVLRESRNLLEERVRERTAELVKTVALLQGEIEQRKRTERLLRLEEARLEALLHVTNIHEGSVNEICHFILEQGIALTNSKIGFIGFLSEDESVYTLHAVSKAIVGNCSVAGDPMHWPVSSAGIWADAIRQRKTLYVNDYHKARSAKEGLPAGHIPLDRFMIVPLFEDDRIVVVAGVGNKTSNYDSADERQMTLLLAGMWNYVQRKRSAEAIQQRTAELSKLNVELEKEVAERRRAEQSLWERSRDLDAFFSHSITPLAILDREFNFVRVNKAYAEADERDISEFAGHNHFEFYPHEENQQIFEQVVRTKTPYEAFAKPFSFPNHPEWGVTYWDWTLVPVLGVNRQVELLMFSLKDVTERVRAENEIRANQMALRELAAELQLAEERERRQIAQDLHDSIGQILAFSGRELRYLRKSLPHEAAGIVEEVVEQLDTAVGQTRTLSFDLSPGILYDLGFEAAVEDLIDKMNEAGHIHCRFQSCSYPKPLADDVKVLLYRSIRELLINAAKHAKADKVEVSLLRSDCDIYVKVEDDGRGFDADILNDDLNKRKGFGLFSIRERLNHIGGSLKIESAAGKGTKAILIAPLDIEDQVERS